jgi:hypothetical protein
VRNKVEGKTPAALADGKTVRPTSMDLSKVIGRKVIGTEVIGREVIGREGYWQGGLTGLQSALQLYLRPSAT